MRILVTGATGFVGAVLVPALRAAGHRVHTPTREVADLERTVEWTPLLEGIDAVVHLAGVAHAGRALPDGHYDQINHLATADLARAAKAAGARLIFLSSIRAQTGPTAATVLTETSPAVPVDAYGRSKLAAEHAIRAAGGPHTIFRPVLIYGPALKGNLATLARLAAKPVPLPFGAFRNRRSLLSIASLVVAIERALVATTSETYLVADRDPIALTDLIAAFRTANGRRRWLVPVPPALMRAALRLAGGKDLHERVGGELVVDPAKLAATGWAPVLDTSAELRRVLARVAPV